MGSIRHLASGKSFTLSSRYLVGRGPACDLRLDQRSVSGEHAVFQWIGSSWVVRDLDSRNGTYVNQQKMQTRKPAELWVGVKVAFGDRNDPYEFEDDAAPEASARTADGESVTSEDGLLILPDPNHPELTIFTVGENAWLAEDMSGERWTVHDNASIESGGRTWQLSLPRILDATLPVAGDDNLHATLRVGLRFEVSPDEDTVELSLLQGKTATDLGVRAHNYMLLLLARRRLLDQRTGELPTSEQGWVYVDHFLDDLKITENQLNTYIFRARRHFAQLGIADAPALFQRRPNTRQLRLGIDRLEIRPW
ncbi:MAG: FHA domain-containing protein [Myxococcota bacterium]